jgi:outer membrane lipoprotein-sorting protein
MAKSACWMLLFAALLMAVAGAQAADTARSEQDWKLPQLMASLQQVQAAKASFVERKFMRILREPLQSSGQLVYVRPDKLQKDTILPKPERLTVEGGQLTIEQQGDKTRQLALQDFPQIWAFVESIRATLAGDLPTLTRFYDVSLQGRRENWTLQLVPKDNKTRALVSIIRISGDNETIRNVKTEEADGDFTSMTIVAETR